MASRCDVSNKLGETENELNKWVPNRGDFGNDFGKIKDILNESMPDGGE